MNFRKMLARLLMKTDFAKKAVNECADLSIFRQKPTGKMIIGFTCIAGSYIFCWPLISLLGLFSISAGKPFFIVVGGPLLWISTHFLCMFGIYLSGLEHSKALMKWLVRVFVEKHAA